MQRFESLGVIKNELIYDNEMLIFFEEEISRLKSSKSWAKVQLVDLFRKMIPAFGHRETGKYLDGKM